MNKEIAIIGVNGNMGKWFANYFHKKGFMVKGFDTNNEIKEKFIVKANSLVSAILNIDYVILCIPTKKTPETIRLISKEMKRGSYLIEISSHKFKTSQALLKMPAKINPICIHPMFGPGTIKIKNNNIILVPIKDVKKELAVTKSLFQDANFITIDADQHDKKIAVILGLTHLMNIVFAKILAKDETSSLTEKMAGTTFKAQKIIAESILSESPELIETIISNPEVKRFGDELYKDIGRILADAQDGKNEDIVQYIKTAQENISKNIDLKKSYKKLSSIISKIEK
jgi:prephenate dehydrogenase